MLVILRKKIRGALTALFRSTLWRVIVQTARASAVVSLVVAALNSTSLKRQSLEQAAAAQLRYALSASSVVDARAAIREAVFRNDQWDFSSGIQSISNQVNTQLNSLELTAGLVNEGVIDANTVCRQIGQRVFFWVKALLINEPGSGVGVAPFVPAPPNTITSKAYPELRTLYSNWFPDGKYFPESSDDYRTECEKVAPSLRFWRVLFLH